MDKFDLIIIGGGSGGIAAAIRANQLQAKTALINGGLPIGGTCVNVGCVPSKTLLWAAEVLYHAKQSSIPGIDTNVSHFDFEKVIHHERNLVKKLRAKKYEEILSGLEHVAFIEGRAKFVSPHEIEINNKKISAHKFILATGSTANVPPIKGISDVGFMIHIEALKINKLPQEMVIIGAGYIGLEFAQMYSRFGTKITILEKGKSIFPHGEKELIDQLIDIFNHEGITFKTNATVISARKKENKKELNILIDGKEETINCDEILLAAGKTANTKDLALEAAHVEINKRQAIIVDKFLATSQPHIFAIGDAAYLPLRLETTAAAEGTIAAENALKETTKNINYKEVPYTIFSDPQYSSIGYTEEEVIQKEGMCECRTISSDVLPKAIITGRTKGMIKIVINPKTRQILGIHILSPYSSDLIAQAMMIVKNKNTIDDVISSLPIFPSYSEIIKLCALSFTQDISKLPCCI